jgi:hypothetical protein
MKWMKERDLLIAQTMAFVQSISGKKPEIELRAGARTEFVPIDVKKTERSVETVQIARAGPVSRTDVRAEIQARVEAFRAHQQLFHRGRDEYFRSVLTKVRDSIDSGLKPPGN